LFLIGILLTAVWDPRAGCVITSTDNGTLSATFIYSMCFDFIVLCLTGYKLSATGNRSRLVHLMFADGLVYFFVAYVWQITFDCGCTDPSHLISFLANLIAVVCPLSSVTALPPAHFIHQLGLYTPQLEPHHVGHRKRASWRCFLGNTSLLAW
jgi:hypothetical protein